jgi:hypothetical protein
MSSFVVAVRLRPNITPQKPLIHPYFNACYFVKRLHFTGVDVFCMFYDPQCVST